MKSVPNFWKVMYFFNAAINLQIICSGIKKLPQTNWSIFTKILKNKILINTDWAHKILTKQLITLM